MASVPFKVKALYEYTSAHEDDLGFEVGQIITVTDEEDDDWYGGEFVDQSGVKQEGIFPRNFVEKYEPVAPPRPARTRKKEPDVASPPPPPVAAPAEVEPEEPEPEHEQEAVEEPSKVASPPPVVESPPAVTSPPEVPVAKPQEPEPISAPAPAPIPVRAPANPGELGAAPVPAEARPPPKAPVPSRSGPPVAEKPSGNSFKDRIAAFNKPAAAPIAPFKPGGLSGGSGGFIKKPYVPPPPSKNAYVPPPREVPAPKVYRREEDPEIKEREDEAQENAEKAGLVPGSVPAGEDDDQPKPTSLKDRIALLQKQQAEQAQRHADAASKKEKPKRPQKKRTESDDVIPAATEEVAEPAPLERQNTSGTAGRQSLDSQPERQPLPARRKSTRGPDDTDGNEADLSGAGDTTEGQEDLTERDDSDAPPRAAPIVPVAASTSTAPQSKDEDDVEEEEEEDEDVDPEVKRKEELRARMAKMSGGMGMMGMGMFGAPPPAPPKKKKSSPPLERRPSEQPSEEPTSPRMAAPPIPTPMALPGMGKQQAEEEVEDDATGDQMTPVATKSPEESSLDAPPPVPGGRPAPPPVPAGSRPPPPPPPAAASQALSAGSESDDEESEVPKATPTMETSPGVRAPPPIPVASPPLPSSPRASISQDSSHADVPMSPAMPPPPPDRRNSRPPPPIPGAAPIPPTQSRPPPPPPPGNAPGRSSIERVTSPMKPGALDNGEEGEVTEYEGDYDTDIGSSVHHKDALKAHARESSFDDNASLRSPQTEAPPSMPPPIPSSAAPSSGPPPIPSQPPPPSRQSVDQPRAAPPPPPAVNTATSPSYDDEYDPYNYSSPQNATTPMSATVTRHEEPPSFPEPPATQQSPPPPPPVARAPPSAAPPAAPPLTSRPSHRQSLDVPRTSIGGRRSIDANRPTVETGFMANDIDLAIHTNWWLAPNSLPPALHGRKDIYYECDESTSSAADGRTSVTKDVFILYQDYSQTIITIVFDPQNPSGAQVEQRHEAPPRSLRQDELESAYETYGTQIAKAVVSKKDSVVGDGTPHALVHELLKPLKDVLRPVGTRGFGALVYANMANASTQINDEIRPGDIISVRNAKFQGKHGAMHSKYSMEVGKPDHVGVVAEWDGVKKKVRAWEQGRENKKVKQESFRLDDLRSGEVKIWRVMPRSWVGWAAQN